MIVNKAVLVERIRSSLFVIPMIYVVGGAALASAMITIDDRVGPSSDTLPFFLSSTVESAQSILGTIAGATITVAGIAFSISLLVIQMASSQHSPRVVHGLFRDPRNKRVMGIVLGTFTYCLVVLQAVRSATTDDGSDIIPNLSIALAVVLGIVAVLAIVAFINNNAHAMEISEVLQSVTEQTLGTLGGWSDPNDPPPPLPMPDLDDDGFVVTFDTSGWVQHIEPEALRTITEPGGTVRFETGVGRYAIEGLALCMVWPVPSDPDRVIRQARSAVHLGRARTLGQDPAYGVRQLADVGIRALSAGIDDPTTAQDAIFHLAAILRAMHHRVPPPAVTVDDEDRCLVLSEAVDQAGMIDLAFDELRRSASAHPAVCIYLLEAISSLCRAFEPEPPAEAREALEAQAALIVEGARAAGLLAADLAQVERAHTDRFGGVAG